jgi:hypothetical protein
MGLIILLDNSDVRFPRRLFSALAEMESTDISKSHRWRGLKLTFEGGGCMLNLSELSERDLVLFSEGIKNLKKRIEGTDEYAGFNSVELNKIFDRVWNSLMN